MKSLRIGILACVALLLGACAGTPSQPSQPKGADLSGNWILTTESQMGAQDAAMSVRQTGSALAGTITGQAGSVDYTGSVNGSAVAFDFVINIQGTDLKLDYSGTVEGDTIKGKAVFGQFGEGTFTAKRK
ncbi:hypothetical protein [Steroidobacter sp.]|uniref:hypothetical protein n=1 Tax=Steroidobacter sp. TaxID=1978227 RepID=UPI001A5A365D|nr:hypothetical protein [Steroidobacter sp.]MBL8266319.1 hypothetical protein [Steroidobacter sp.]